MSSFHSEVDHKAKRFLFMINGVNVNQRLAVPSSIPESYCFMFRWLIYSTSSSCAPARARLQVYGIDLPDHAHLKKMTCLRFGCASQIKVHPVVLAHTTSPCTSLL